MRSGPCIERTVTAPPHLRTLPLKKQPCNMNPLTDSDRHHLRAAEGWLELGDHLSANEELEQIEPQNGARVAVLHLRWDIYA